MITVANGYLNRALNIGEFCHKRKRREMLHAVIFSVDGKIFMCAFHCCLLDTP